MKQYNLFANESIKDESERKYSSKIDSPIYEPKNIKPHIIELLDKSKTHRLIKEIDQSFYLHCLLCNIFYRYSHIYLKKIKF